MVNAQNQFALLLSCAIVFHCWPNVGECDEGKSPPVVIKNSIGMDLVRIQPGEFLMGAHEDDAMGRKFDKPQHRVRISKPFYIGRCEVTVRQFRDFAEDRKYTTQVEKSRNGGYGLDVENHELTNGPRYSWKTTGFPQDENHPVVNVNWYDAVEFCKWISAKEGAVYRLPREAEWEFCARAGTTTRFSFGDDDGRICEFANVWDQMLVRTNLIQSVDGVANCSDGWTFTAPVGHYKPSPWGLSDFHGNVREWCFDWRYKYSEHEQVDPVQIKDTLDKIIRGGSWLLETRNSGSSLRGTLDPVESDCDLGFRVVREIQTD